MMSAQPFEQPSAAVVQITLGEVFNEVRAMHQELRDLNSSLSPVKAQVADHEVRLRAVDGMPDDVKALKETSGDHEERIRSVERRAAMYAGGAAVFAGSAGSLITWALTAR